MNRIAQRLSSPLLLLLLCWMMPHGPVQTAPAQASADRKALSGSASIRAASSRRPHPYFPHEAMILEADSLAARYRLDAAEALYRRALQENPRSAGALNGLGKIAMSRTASSNPHERAQIAAYRSKAIQYWLSALRYQPGYAEARLNLANAYMAQGRMGEAHEEISRAIGLTPRRVEGWAAMGAWLVGNHRYNEAVPLLEKAIRLDARNVSAHYHLAIAREARNETDAALRNLHAALWLDPRHAAAHERMARIYEAGGNEAAAVEHYLQALSLDPEMTGSRLRLATLYERRGDFPEALTQLKNALSNGAEADWTLTERTARLSIRNEQPEIAVALYRDWVEKFPDDTTRVQPLLSGAKTAFARKKLRDPDLMSQGEAGRTAGQAIRQNPDNFDARLIRSRFDREIGRESIREVSANITDVGAKTAADVVPLFAEELGETESPTDARSTQAADPTDPAVMDAALRQPTYQPGGFYEKGEMLLSRYQFDAAIRAFREARRAGENHYNPVTFGELFLTIGLPDLAEESFNVALSHQPDSLAARLGLARAASAKRESEEWVAEAKRDARRPETLQVAVSRLEKALHANRMNARAYDLLARLEEKQGHFPKAADYYYARLQLEPDAPGANAARRGLARVKQATR